MIATIFRRVAIQMKLCGRPKIVSNDNDQTWRFKYMEETLFGAPSSGWTRKPYIIPTTNGKFKDRVQLQNIQSFNYISMTIIVNIVRIKGELIRMQKKPQPLKRKEVHLNAIVHRLDDPRIKEVATLCLNPYPNAGDDERILKREYKRHWVMTVTVDKKQFHLISFQRCNLSKYKPLNVIRGEEYYAICYEGCFYNAGSDEGKLITEALKHNMIPEIYLLVTGKTA